MQYVIEIYNFAPSSLNIQVNISNVYFIASIIKLYLSKLQGWSSTLQCLFCKITTLVINITMFLLNTTTLRRNVVILVTSIITNDWAAI